MSLYPESLVLFVADYNRFFSTSAFILGIVSIWGSISGESIFRVLLRVDWTITRYKDVFQLTAMHHTITFYFQGQANVLLAIHFVLIKPSNLVFLRTQLGYSLAVIISLVKYR